MANKIKIKRGLKANLPTLSVGEQGLCTDTSEIFIGGSTGNIQLANKEYVDSQLAQIGTERGYITSKTLTSADNLDNVVANGKYWCNGALNYPENQEQGFFDVIAFGTNFVSQKFVVNYSGSDYFLRNRVSGVWSAWKKVSYSITPVEKVITSGFTIGWSGEIRIRKNQEGQKTMTWLLTRNADIVASEGVFALSQEDRPLYSAYQHVIGRVASTGSFVPNSLIGVDVIANTGIIVFSNAGVSTNVRMVVGTMTFY